jgi:CHAT domain-containing protein/Tfp pilus assembly protein PilF
MLNKLRLQSILRFVLACLFFSSPAALCSPQQDGSEGVVVEEVSKGSAGEKAGLQAQDRILSWSREQAAGADSKPEGGKIVSWLDLAGLQGEQLRRGPVSLSGTRGASTMTWKLSGGLWSGFQYRPVLPENLLSLDREAKSLLNSKKTEEAVARWRTASDESKKAGQHDVAAWFLYKMALILRDARMWAEADSAYGALIEEATRLDHPLLTAEFLRSWGGSYRSRSDLQHAFECYQRGLEFAAKAGPGHLEASDILGDLGNVDRTRGDLDAAERDFRRAKSILEELAPNSLLLAYNYVNLGIILGDRGDLQAAEDSARRARVIFEKLAPDSFEAAQSLNNLALLDKERGDLAAAEEYYRQALAIKEKIAPESLSAATTLNNLGAVAAEREDWPAAETYYKRALAIREKLAPEGLDVAVSLMTLAEVARQRDDWTLADDLLKRALAIELKLAPEGPGAVAALYTIGRTEDIRGNLQAAAEYMQRAQVIQEKFSSADLSFAAIIHGLGYVAFERGDLPGAEEQIQRALTIEKKLGDISGEAGALYTLGLIYRRNGKPALATDYFCQAVDAIELQKAKLGGTQEAKAGFGASRAQFYRACLEGNVEINRPNEALLILERSRASLLLAMLAERDLVFASDVPADLARERKLTDADFDRTQTRIARLSSAKDAEEIDRQLAHLQELREKQAAIADRIRAASPRFAALQYPRPLDLQGVREALDPGTVLLSYSIAGVQPPPGFENEKSFLFVIQPLGAESSAPNGLSVFQLPITGEELAAKLEAFRNLIERHNLSDLPILKQKSTELYDLLIRPADPLIASSRRVLISPDGPLDVLPFAALLRKGTPGKKGESDRYLIEWKPIHTIVSATLYAEINKARRTNSATSSFHVVAFGDPKYPAAPNANSVPPAGSGASSPLPRGVAFEPLPYTRAEIQDIAKLYPQQASLYLGPDATEERAKSIGKDVRYIHFAVHGLLDEHFPLNSALVFTIPEKQVEGQDNGFLQAWEIFEQVHIDADLVTLSACETALGKEMRGEGLIGLTRAFQYAGAHSVLASLWSVSDESTAELMKRFYAHLKAGKSKDEALRAAQMALIRTNSKSASSPSEMSHPFHWAAFQLTGDWK